MQKTEEGGQEVQIVSIIEKKKVKCFACKEERVTLDAKYVCSNNTCGTIACIADESHYFELVLQKNGGSYEKVFAGDSVVNDHGGKDCVGKR